MYLMVGWIKGVSIEHIGTETYISEAKTQIFYRNSLRRQHFKYYTSKYLFCYLDIVGKR